MKKNVENLMDDLKKAAEEVKVEVVKKKEAVIEEQQKDDDLKKKKKKKKGEDDVKVESSVEDDSAVVGEEQKKSETDQKQTKEKTEVPITEYSIKQQVVNSYIEDVAKLKRQITDLEQDNNKLHSYHASSYVLERIFNLKSGDDDSEKNKKRIG
ncbi:titin homolog [Helianthus annuus]|uniref:titin homolog n=1 Tax=Helianthus annuus TaxID=4232 RepID=UPI001652BA14|nr:titin homolog [Helianthus annuus]